MRNPLLHSNEPSRMNRLIAKCREGLNSCAQRLGSREPLRFWAIAGAVLCLSLAGCFSLAHLAQRGSAKKEAKVTIAAVTAPAASLQSASTLAQPENKAPQEVTPKKSAVAKPVVANNQSAPAPTQQVAPSQVPLRPLVLAPPTISDAKLDGEKEDGDISRKRESWFFDQRAYPNKHIPAGAYQKALEQRDAMKAAQRSASSSGTNADAILINFPGDALWHLMGPQPIDNHVFGMNGGSPTASGRITAIAVDNTDATGNTVYIGGAAGGVWKTTNGGTTWTPLTDSQPSLAVGSITIDPNNSQTIYVGTGEENFNLDAFYGAGILKSTNGGTTWTQLGASTFAQALTSDTGGAYIGQIAVQPGNPNIVLAAVSYILNGTVGGIYRSIDGGTTWTEDTSPQGLGATSVFFESTSNAGTTATAWMAMGDPFGVTSANGIYKSTDSGATWTLQTGGLPTTSLGRIILGYAPSTSGAGATIYAAIATSASNNNSSDLLGFFKTVNGGTSWTSITGPDGGTFGFCNHQCFYDMAIGVHPTNPNVVVIGGGPYNDNFTSLFESKDGGSTWTPSSSSGNPVAGNFANGSTTAHVHVDTHAIVFNASASLLYVGDDGGIWSTNTPAPGAGTSPTWSDLNASLAITQFYPGPSSAVSDDNYGFGGTQDNDTELFQNSLTWQNEFICGDGGFTAIDQSTPTTIWAACNVTAGTKVKKAVFNGQFITVGVGGPAIPGFDVAETAITSSGDAMEFIPPLALDDNTPDNLYFGTCRVWWANNAASSLANTFIPLVPNWAAVSGDLTTPANANSPSTCTVQGTGITNLEVAHSNDSIVVAGTSNGKIWETQQAGIAFPPPALPFWTELDTSALPGRTVTAVRTQRNDSTGAIVYATFSGFGHCTGCDLKGHVFKTTNATTVPPTWTDISGDLPDIPVNDIIVDHDSNPAHDALYIATDVGVFACPNPTAATPCANWTVIGDGLPNSPVLGLTLRRNSRILSAATHGRSTWDIQLTDVGPPNLAFISSMTPAYAKAGAASTAITLNGGNFSNNTQVQFASVTTGVTTSFVSTTQLNVTFGSTLLQNGGVFPITLVDSQGVDPGSALGTGGLPFTVENPSLDPLTMTPATAEAYTAVHLHFTAAAAEPFLPNSVIAFYNVPPVTTPPTAPTLQFQLPMILEQPTLSSGGAVYDLTTAITDLTIPGNYWVIPYNPAPGGAIDPIAINAPSFGLSGPVPFQFTLTANPGPVIQVSSPLTLVVSALGANTGTTYDTFQVTNLVGATLNITAATIGGTVANGSGNFQFIAPATGLTSCNFETGSGFPALTAGSSCFFGLEYTAGTPPGNAQSNATLNITDNATASPQSFPITGLIAPNAGLLLLTPVNFGAVALGTSSPTMNATLENASSSAVNVTSAFSISGTNPADFHLVPFVSSGDGLSACPATPFTLPAVGTPGFACDVSLNFTPSSAGNETAQLNVTASVAVTTSTPNLLGTGVELTSISPQVVATGGPAFTLVVNGGGFASSAVVNVNGSARLTTFINSTQLQASIPASDIATAGSLAISVTSPSPGGTTSEPKTLIVAQATEANNDNINFARTPNFGTTTLRTASGSFSGGTTGVTLNWSSAFPDTNYTAICSAETTVGDFLLPIITLRTTTAITVVPTGGGTPSGNIACFAIPDSDTSDIRHGRTVYSGAPATITVTWNAAFPDTTYVTACTVETQGATGGGFSSVISALATTSVTAINGGIAAGTMHCIGVPVTDRSAVRRSKTAISGTPATVAVSFNTSFANTTAVGGNYAAVCSDVQLGVTGSDAALAISLGSRTDTGFTVINEIPSGTLHCLAVPLGDSAPVRFTEDTTQATAQLAASSGSPLTPPDPTPTVACAGSAAQQGRAKSVWWNWVAPANGTLIADSRFGSYTTVLSAWTLSAPLPTTTETFTQVGCASGNLAAVAPFPAATLMSVNVTAGTTYYIMASDASAGGAGGTLTLNMDFASTDPANDDNVAPTVIAAAPFTATENTIPATANTNSHSDPTPPAGCATGAASNGQANSVWFEYTPSSNGTIVADTLTSRYETILNVTSGTPTGTQVACNQSAQSGIAQSQVTFAATSGTAYFFMVSAFLGDGGTTNFHLNFTPGASNPVPTITSISPTSATAGGAGFTVTVNGTNFISGSVVNFNGTALTTTFVSATQVTASVTAAQIATAGTFPVTVTNPAPGGGTSNSTNFTVNNPSPTLTSISPTSATAGSAGFTLTLTGTNFVSNSVVNFNGTAETTTFVSATQLTASIPASAVATAGTFPVTVTSPTPGGGTSGSVTFTVNNPAPTITSLSPNGATVGGAAFTLTVNGTGFVSTSQVKFNGNARTTTFVSSTQVTAAILASDIATVGTVQVTVTNPTPGGGTSGNSPFTISSAPNPVPTLTSISPTNGILNQSVTLTLTGTNFISASLVNFGAFSDGGGAVSNGGDTLTITIPAAQLNAAGNINVSVTNPSPGGGTSGTQVFQIFNPVPTITSLSPSSATVGGPAFTLTVNGTNFINGAVVDFNGSNVTTTFVSATQITAAIPASALVSPGTALVSVQNPAPTTGSSPTVNFTINNPGPTLTSVSPTSTAAGGPQFTMTLTGTGFVNNSSVLFNGTPQSTTFVSSTQLTATILASEIVTAGTVNVAVNNPAPGGGTSGNVTFTISNPVPAITSINPTSATAGGATFSLVVTGTGFVSNSKVNFNGTVVTTAFNSSTQLSASITAAEIATGGTFPVTVTNPAPGGGTSGSVNFTVNNPTPTLTSVSPTSATAGGAAFTLTLTGSSFVNGAAVAFNGTAAATTFVSATQLTASIPAADIVAAGTYPVTVTNPTPGGGTSASVSFTVNNAVPTITSLSPNSVTAGSIAFTLTVNGTSFVSGSVVNFNGSARTTTFVSSTQITAAITATDIANAGNAAITVTNPVPGGGTSAASTLTINNPLPTISSLSPTGVTAGGAAFTLTVNGTNFVSNSVVKFNGNAKTTTFVSATQLTAAILASDISTAGNANVTVSNPTPGGGTTANFVFNVASAPNPVPTLTSISPTSATAGGAAFTLTLTGTNFVASSVVNFNGVGQTTTVVSGTQLTASIPASAITTAGIFPVTVTNPAPGGGTTAAINFTVNNPVPSISSLSPASATFGGAGFTLTVNGSAFVNGSTVSFNGSNRATTFVSSSQVTAAITATDIAAVGSFPIVVTNPTPGGGASTAVNFSVNNPPPAITSLSPSNATAGGAAFTLTVTGTAFVSGAVVNFNGTAATTTFVSSTQLTAAIPATDIATGGAVNVTITNPAPGGGTSAPATFTINNPLPTITTLSPSSALAGSAAFTLTITGTNFVSTSVVNFGGKAVATTFVGAAQLTASVTAAEIATAGPVTVTVTNPAPGGGTSAASTFTVNNHVPTITTLSPVSATAGSAAFTLTVNGTNFVSTSVVNFNGTAATTTFVSATQITAAITAAEIATPGAVNVTVTNPAPGGGTSGNATFTINNPVPTTTSLAPTSTTAGGAAFVLTVNGTNFTATSVVNFNGAAQVTTFKSATQLTAAITAAEILTAATVNVTVTNPTPGGGTSAPALQFTINNVQPVLTTLSPTSTLAGGAAFTLTVNGNAGTFVQGAVVSFNGKAETTTFVNSGQLTAAITAPDIATAGNVNVIVTNPAPAVGPSAALTFAVNNPVPTITAATAAGQNHIAGGAAFTLTVTGTNFVTGTNEASVVSFNGKTETTTFVSGTQITAAIPANDAATAGTFNVSVSNPGPGGGPTPTTVTFTIDGYTLSGPGSAVTVKAGTPATIPVTITPTANGFANAVVFSVTGLPANSSVVPLTVPNVTAKTTVNLTINTTARGAAPPAAPVDEPLPPAVRLLMVTWICALLAAAYAIIIMRRRPQLRRYAALVPLALLLVSGVVLAGCASAMKGTPMGTSQLTVTATSGTLSQSAQATLTVQ